MKTSKGSHTFNPLVYNQLHLLQFCCIITQPFNPHSKYHLLQNLPRHLNTTPIYLLCLLIIIWYILPLQSNKPEIHQMLLGKLQLQLYPSPTTTHAPSQNIHLSLPLFNSTGVCINNDNKEDACIYYITGVPVGSNGTSTDNRLLYYQMNKTMLLPILPEEILILVRTTIMMPYIALIMQNGRYG